MNGTSGNWTMPVLGGHHGNHHHHAAGNGSTQAEVSGNDTTTVLQEAVNQLHKMTEWMVKLIELFGRMSSIKF